MKILRYFFGTLWVVFVWLMVGIITGMIVIMIFPPHEKLVTVGIGLDWRNLPGTILGVFRCEAIVAKTCLAQDCRKREFGGWLKNRSVIDQDWAEVEYKQRASPAATRIRSHRPTGA